MSWPLILWWQAFYRVFPLLQHCQPIHVARMRFRPSGASIGSPWNLLRLISFQSRWKMLDATWRSTALLQNRCQEITWKCRWPGCLFIYVMWTTKCHDVQSNPQQILGSSSNSIPSHMTHIDRNGWNMIEPQSELIQYPVRFLGSCEWRQGDETRRSPRRFTSFATARSLQRRDCGCSTAGCSWSIQEIQKGRWKRRVRFHKSQRVDGVGLKQGKKQGKAFKSRTCFNKSGLWGSLYHFLIMVW